MEKIIWVIGGAAAATIAFFIPEQSGSMWPSVLLSGSVILLYLGVFSFVWLKKIKAPFKRKMMGGILVTLIILSGASASLSFMNSSRQSKLLPAIRTTIETGIARMHINEPLLKTLRAYRVSQDKKPGIGVGDLFLARYDSLVGEQSVFNYVDNDEDRTLTLFLKKAEADSVVLIGESTYVEGLDSKFQNFSGNTGRFQVRGILTSQGVDYERIN